MADGGGISRRHYTGGVGAMRRDERRAKRCFVVKNHRQKGGGRLIGGDNSEQTVVSKATERHEAGEPERRAES